VPSESCKFLGRFAGAACVNSRQGLAVIEDTGNHCDRHGADRGWHQRLLKAVIYLQTEADEAMATQAAQTATTLRRYRTSPTATQRHCTNVLVASQTFYCNINTVLSLYWLNCDGVSLLVTLLRPGLWGTVEYTRAEQQNTIKLSLFCIY